MKQHHYLMDVLLIFSLPVIQLNIGAYCFKYYSLLCSVFHMLTPLIERPVEQQ